MLLADSLDRPTRITAGPCLEVSLRGQTGNIERARPAEKLRDTPGLSFVEAPLMIGTPDDIIEEIERYESSSRVTHLVMWMQLAGMPADKTERSMKLFAEEVMPYFRKAN